MWRLKYAAIIAGKTIRHQFWLIIHKEEKIDLSDFFLNWNLEHTFDKILKVCKQYHNNILYFYKLKWGWLESCTETNVGNTRWVIVMLSLFGNTTFPPKY